VAQDRHVGSPASAHPSRRGPLTAWAAIVGVALVGGVLGGLIVKATTSSARGGSATAAPFCSATAVAAAALPAVVTISVRGPGGTGSGSGELIRDGGYILTNDHVIAAAVPGGQLSVRFSGGQTSPAQVVGADPLTDLAVLRASDVPASAHPIAVGSSAAVVVGQAVVAVGAPLGLDETVTAGIVSALDRYVPVPGSTGQTAHLVDALQTDAAINPGNSGGALTNCVGALVGVTTAIATVPNAAGTPGGGSVGVGFAIPVDLALPLADRLIATGRPDHPTLGLTVQTVQASDGTRGLRVTSTTPGGPAASAGLQVDDVITQVDGHPVATGYDLVVAALRGSVGQSVEVTYQRGGTPHQASLTLAAPG